MPKMISIAMKRSAIASNRSPTSYTKLIRGPKFHTLHLRRHDVADPKKMQSPFHVLSCTSFKPEGNTYEAQYSGLLKLSLKCDPGHTAITSM